MVRISPGVLEFKGPLTQSSTEYIQVTNDTDEQIVFKVKTTAPKLYCVRPNSHNVFPGETIDVSVILLGLKEEPEPDYKCNDKFLIVTMPCPYDLGDRTAVEIWPQLESEFKAQSVARKIKVAFVPAEEPVQTQETRQEAGDIAELEQDHSNAHDLESDRKRVTSPPVSTTTNSSSNKNKIVIDASKAHIVEKPLVQDDLSTEDKLKIEMLEEKFDSNVSKNSGTKGTHKELVETPRPMTTTTVILFAFIAFIVGWLFF